MRSRDTVQRRYDDDANELREVAAEYGEGDE